MLYLVAEEDGCVLQQRSGDGHALLLAAAQLQAALAHQNAKPIAGLLRGKEVWCFATCCGSRRGG